MSSIPFWHKSTFAPEAITLSTMFLSIRFSSSRNVFICWGFEMFIFASNSVLSISNAVLINAIFASAIFFGIPPWTTSLSSTMPSTKVESLMEPPAFFSTLTSSWSTMNFSPFLSATARTAFTMSVANISPPFLTSFVSMEVLAILLSTDLSFGVTSSEISLRYWIAFFEAFLYPSTIIVGWTSWVRRDSAFSNSAPASTTADVVPSPTSLSVVFEISTSIFAAGCWTSISLRMVAPSFVIVTSPSESTSILSIPLGPRLLWTTSAMIFAAAMLFFWASRPLLSVAPSFSKITGKFPFGICALIAKNSVFPLLYFADQRNNRCF